MEFQSGLLQRYSWLYVSPQHTTPRLKEILRHAKVTKEKGQDLTSTSVCLLLQNDLLGH